MLTSRGIASHRRRLFVLPHSFVSPFSRPSATSDALSTFPSSRSTYNFSVLPLSLSFLMHYYVRKFFLSLASAAFPPRRHHAPLLSLTTCRTHPFLNLDTFFSTPLNKPPPSSTQKNLLQMFLFIYRARNNGLYVVGRMLQAS